MWAATYSIIHWKIILQFINNHFSKLDQRSLTLLQTKKCNSKGKPTCPVRSKLMMSLHFADVIRFFLISTPILSIIAFSQTEISCDRQNLSASTRSSLKSPTDMSVGNVSVYKCTSSAMKLFPVVTLMVTCCSKNHKWITWCKNWCTSSIYLNEQPRCLLKSLASMRGAYCKEGASTWGHLLFSCTYFTVVKT